MKLGKYHVDTGLLIALTVLLASVILAGGAILTWGPADSRAAVIDWGAKLAALVVGLYGILRGRGLLQEHSGDEHDPPR